MSYVTTLVKLYDYLDSINDPDLLPLGCSKQNAHITVTVDKDGNFVKAEFIPYKECETTIPVTEDSASRSSGAAPHPLFDTIKYLDASYGDYTGEKGSQKYHEAYMSQLEGWCKSSFSNKKVCAVLAYLQQERLIENCVNEGLFFLDENAQLVNSWKNKPKDMEIAKDTQKKAFIRFAVEGFDDIPELWLDKEVSNSFYDYDQTLPHEKCICHVTGEETRLAVKHPRRIRYPGDNTRLISSNDKQDYTYRGLFHELEQAYAMGYDTSQKFHKALIWAIAHQSVRMGELYYVVFSDKKLPVNITLGSEYLVKNYKEEAGEMAPEMPFTEILELALKGYRQLIRPEQEVYILGLNSALGSTGRLSVIYSQQYGEAFGNNLFDNINYWHKSCVWDLSFFNGQEWEKRYGAPSLSTIINAAYGKESKGRLEVVSDQLRQSTLEKLYPCISDRAKLPVEFLRNAVMNASRPQSYKTKKLWYTVLMVTCALFERYKMDYLQGGKIDMNTTATLETEYKLGQLLAAADEIEKRVLLDKKKTIDVRKIRPTNAERFCTMFVQHPYKAWKIIRGKLNIYANIIPTCAAEPFNLMEKIESEISMEDFDRARNLSAACYQGFDTQRRIYEEFRMEQISRLKKLKAEKEQ